MSPKKDDPQTREQALTVLRFAWDYTMLDPAGFAKCIELLSQPAECGHNDTYLDASRTVVCNGCGKRFEPEEFTGERNWDEQDWPDAPVLP
jgi:hypothetical protein